MIEIELKTHPQSGEGMVATSYATIEKVAEEARDLATAHLGLIEGKGLGYSIQLREVGSTKKARVANVCKREEFLDRVQKSAEQAALRMGLTDDDDPVTRISSLAETTIERAKQINSIVQGAIGAIQGGEIPDIQSIIKEIAQDPEQLKAILPMMKEMLKAAS